VLEQQFVEDAFNWILNDFQYTVTLSFVSVVIKTWVNIYKALAHTHIYIFMGNYIFAKTASSCSVGHNF